MNASHDGNSPLGAPPPPLTRLWSRTFNGEVSYAVIAADKVFVTVANPQDFSEGYGTRLYALDARTGETAWAPLALGGEGFWSSLTFGDGRLFAVNYNGVLRAFDVATGGLVWERDLDSGGGGVDHFTSPLTFHNGLVYVGAAGSSGGGLFAIRAATGSVAWSQRVYHGDNSSPAVDGNGVYVSYTCGIKHAFAPTTGARLWQTPATCSSSGGRTPVLAAGRLWTRDPSASAGYSVNPADGGVLDRFASTTYRVPAPAFRGRTGLFMDNGRLRASDADTPTVPIWTFTGDGQLSSAPIVVNDHVYVGSGSGQLWALDPITGAPVWSTNVGAPIKEPNELGGNPPTTGLTAGQGRLLVPATNTLSAYGQ